MKKSVLVYWLIPAKAERELFRSLIRILAKRLDAPTFEPHLTVCVGQDRQSPREMLRRLKASPLQLQIRGTSHSSNFRKTLFVRLRPNRGLEQLARALGGLGPRDPHLSLLYKKLPTRTKKELVATIRLPMRTVTFSAIKAVRSKSPTTTAADVKGWRVIATKRLSG
jgi:2'-5' RNA ligase